MTVHDNLLELQEKLPGLLKEMLDHLSKRPFEYINRKYFIMKQYRAWEYRFNLKNRVYLQVYPDERRVYIYGAGAHPKEKVPKPPKAESIEWSKFMVI
jgi:hypothetical protein